jgi:hypothetical protein
VNSNNPFPALFCVAASVFVILFFERRASATPPDAEIEKPGILCEIAYYFCKWTLIIFTISFCFAYLTFWPPHWLERNQQRKIVMERVQQAGGWDAIKKDCNDLVLSNSATGYEWFSRGNDTNNPALPKSLAILKPRMVDLWPEKDGMQSIRIQIFGMHSTGGRGQDFYILKVVCPLPPNIKPPFSVDPNAKVQYGDTKIVDGVYVVTHNG